MVGVQTRIASCILGRRWQGVPFEKAIDLVEDLKTQHMLQLGLA
jgi:hypothetical protein